MSARVPKSSVAIVRVLVLSLMIGAVGGPLSAEAAFQAPGERAAQNTLPKSAAPLWTTLRHAKVGEDPKRGLFTIAFTDDVKALAGRTVTLSGFMLPLDEAAATRHFLLSKYTPVCFFCPPGEPNEVVEVINKKGIKLTDKLITVTGRFALNNDGEKGLFFRIDQAS
jgi:hypothetical protein